MAFLADFRSAVDGEDAAPESGGDVTAAGARTEHATGAARHGNDPEPSAWLGDPYMGSDVQVDPAWWMASDRRWYPPELHPDRMEQPPVPTHEQDGPADEANEAELTAALSRSEEAGRRSRLIAGRPRLGRLRPSPATA